MAVALRRVRDQVRELMNDTDAKLTGFGTVKVDQAIARAYISMGSMLPPAKVVTASAFTISAGLDTFTLPATVTGYTGNDGGAEYAGDVRIRLRTTGRFMDKLTVEEMDSWRTGSPTVSLGVPGMFCLYEASDQGLPGRVYPGAKVDEACDLFCTRVVDDIRDYVGAGTDDMDDVEISFSRYGVASLVYKTAALLVAQMTDEQLKERNLNSGVVNDWKKEARDLLYGEAGRKHQLESTGRLHRNVS